jgi:hypothetical protein
MAVGLPGLECYSLQLYSTSAERCAVVNRAHRVIESKKVSQHLPIEIDDITSFKYKTCSKLKV